MSLPRPLSQEMVGRSVNFHGHQLLKQLTNSHPQDVEALNLKDIDYKVFRARIPEIRWDFESFQGAYYGNKLRFWRFSGCISQK